MVKLCYFRLVLLLAVSNFVFAAEFEDEYAAGDVISPEIFVTDKSGSQVNLASLLGESDSELNVLFIFGGGDMGSGQPGHLWCQDSFEDTHILRTLYSKYRDQGVNFIAVAVSPAYHTAFLGHQQGVFITGRDNSRALKRATRAFVDSTLAAVDTGVLPLEPYFDTRFRLLFNRNPELAPAEEYGQVYAWQGTFRDPRETQFYGVPGFWLLDQQGQVLGTPFRGNIYHPHGAEVSIRYTFEDIDKAIAGHL